ncbi:transient receptor potential cation channel subfamily A member 1-like [Actinia tenebrosa]|uniref:Transient receptor potential cation channel subfamily A member 1-like n=1 Tax=Actinia tenebrosa TaxID=6105 RepID=A0A6P8HTR2_ACTTE|nr:transient receptor potential cation channel subfamily A member 1-like [Actinia tenebrosa]
MASTEKGKYSSLEMQPTNPTEQRAPTPSLNNDNEDDLEDDFDRQFWVEVRSIFNAEEGISWSKAMDKVRVKRLVDKYKANGSKPAEDPLLLLMKQWPQAKKFQGKAELVEPQIHRFAEILLEDKDDMNKDNRYEAFRDQTEEDEKTLLHYVAEQNFYHIARTLIRFCPGLLALKTEAVLTPVKKRALLPVEVALNKNNDEVAAVMLRHMSHERVQDMFSWRPDPELQSPRPSQISFQQILKNPKMKKASVAILDCMVNPHWPYLPDKKSEYLTTEEEEVIEGAWATVPEDPLEYHFYFHVLECDDGGRPPKIKDSATNKSIKNPFYNKKSPSCLSIIANSDNIDAVRHPVVRMLIQSKWQAYGKRLLSIQAIIYMIFLLVLSFALIHGSTRKNPNEYSEGADMFRAVCELIMLLMLFFYIFEEINQIAREQDTYMKDKYNVLDWLGMLLILVIIPLRAINHDSQWSVASIGYLINCFRIFKFSCITKTTGLYTKTLARIIKNDLSRFFVTFAVIFFSFCGALFLSLRATRSQTLLGGFEQVLLGGMRVLTESQPIAEEYKDFNWLSIVLLLVYMGTVIVVLLNILIAQLSTTYAQAKNVAKLEYDVDRMLLLTRMENYPFLNLRVRHYKLGDWISELSLAKELLEFTEERHALETIEQKLTLLRDMMRKMIKTMKPVATKDR